eukprot:Gb_13681 [translate_table: standard]
MAARVNGGSALISSAAVEGQPSYLLPIRPFKKWWWAELVFLIGFLLVASIWRFLDCNGLSVLQYGPLCLDAGHTFKTCPVYGILGLNNVVLDPSRQGFKSRTRHSVQKVIVLASQEITGPSNTLVFFLTYPTRTGKEWQQRLQASRWTCLCILWGVIALVGHAYYTSSVATPGVVQT